MIELSLIHIYARNLLFKKNLGIEATKQNLNDLKLQKQNNDKLEAERLEEAKKLAKELEEKEVVLAIKTGSDGRVFGSVSTKEIAEAAKEQLGYELDKKKMHLKDAIKSIGTFHVPVSYTHLDVYKRQVQRWYTNRFI